MPRRHVEDPHMQNRATAKISSLERARSQWKQAVCEYPTSRKTFRQFVKDGPADLSMTLQALVLTEYVGRRNAFGEVRRDGKDDKEPMNRVARAALNDLFGKLERNSRLEHRRKATGPMRKSSSLHVLCATDGSLASRMALELVQCFRMPAASTLTLLYISEFGVSYPAGLAALELPEDRGETVLEQLKRNVVSSDWKTVRYELLRGRPAETILLATNRDQVDLVAVGAHGRADIPHFLLRSVSRRVVMYAPCPVLVVKGPVAALRHVVIGIDGSQEAEAAAEFLLRLSLPEDTRVTVASVVPPLPHGQAPMREDRATRLRQIRGEVEDEARKIVTHVVEKLRARGCRADGVVVSGHPSHELLKLAEAMQVDLMVVGSRGLTGDTRYLMGSVSDSIVLYAPCAVLVFRQEQGQGHG